jgi:hypothetical protein
MKQPKQLTSLYDGIVNGNQCRARVQRGPEYRQCRHTGTLHNGLCPQHYARASIWIRFRARYQERYVKPL